MVSCRLCNDPRQPMYRRLDLYECGSCGLLQRHGVAPRNGYTTGHLRPPHIPDLIATVQALQEPDTALDIGCNDGTFALALGEAGYRVCGFEPCDVAANVAKSRGVIVMPSLRLAYGVSTVWCRHVLEHVDDVAGFMSDIRCALRSGGLLVLELPDVDEAMRLGSPAILWDEHLSLLESRHIEQLLEREGFGIVARRQYAFGGGSLAFICKQAGR